MRTKKSWPMDGERRTVTLFLFRPRTLATGRFGPTRERRWLEWAKMEQQAVVWEDGYHWNDICWK